MPCLILVVDHDAAFLARVAALADRAGCLPVTVRSRADADRLLAGQVPALVLAGPPEPAEAAAHQAWCAAFPAGVPIRTVTPALRVLELPPDAVEGEMHPLAALLAQEAVGDAAAFPRPGEAAEGELGREPLADFLFAAVRGRLDADLTVGWKDLNTEVEQSWTWRLRRGELAGWSANQEMNLADYLIGQEILSLPGMRAALDTAAHHGTDLTHVLLSPEFGQTARRTGSIRNPEALRGAIVQFALTTLTQPAVIESGRYRFAVRPPEVAAETPLLPLLPIAAELARRLDPSRLTILLSGVSWTPNPHPLPLLPLAELPLTSQEGYFLSQLDGRRDLEQIAATGVLSKPDTYRAFFALLQMRLVSATAQGTEIPYARFPAFLKAKQAHVAALREAVERLDAFPSPPEGASPYTVLGLRAGATPEQVRARYEELSARLRPANFPPEVRRRYKSRITLINARLGDAYLALTPSTVPTDAGDRDSPEARRAEAAKLYQRAMQHLRVNEREEAISVLRLALQYDPANAEYHFQLGGALRGHALASRQVEAEDHFLRATELAPQNGDFALALANCYADKMPSRARRLVQQALARTPKHEGLLALHERLGAGTENR